MIHGLTDGEILTYVMGQPTSADAEEFFRESWANRCRFGVTKKENSSVVALMETFIEAYLNEL